MKKLISSCCVSLMALLFAAYANAQEAQAFEWNWHDWQELVAGQNLRNEKMTKGEQQAIADAIVLQLRPMMADLNIQTEEQLQKAALDTRVKFIDLNHDGIPEVVAQSMPDCSATGNCSLWVFQKVGQKYKLILNGFGQTFTIQKKSTHGYQDIVVGVHESASDSDLTDYHYESGMYREAGCYSASWHSSEGGVERDLKEPVITPCDRH